MAHGCVRAWLRWPVRAGRDRDGVAWRSSLCVQVAGHGGCVRGDRRPGRCSALFTGMRLDGVILGLLNLEDVHVERERTETALQQKHPAQDIPEIVAAKSMPLRLGPTRWACVLQPIVKGRNGKDERKKAKGESRGRRGGERV